MKDVAKHPWLWLRKETGKYYIRARVPVDLTDYYDGEFYKRTLGTKDRREADRLIMTEAALLNEEFERYRRKRDKVETSNVTKAQLWVLVLQWFRDQDQADMEAWQRIDNDEQRANAREVLRDDLGGFGKLDDPRTYDEIAQEADALLYKNNIVLNSTSGLHQYLVQELHNATIELLRRRLGRVDGNFDAATETRFDAPAPSPQAAAMPPNLHPTTLRPKPMSSIVELFVADPAREHQEDRTGVTYDFVFRLMKALIGADTPISNVTREHCRAVRDVLIRLPLNATKRFPSMTTVEAADHATELGLKTRARGTVNTDINKMASFFRWACKEQYIYSHPAEGLQLPIDEDRREKRYSFSLDQLRLIFNAPLYKGCRDDEGGYAVPGDQVVRRARFWVPLISLFHGMRLNEICQLSVGDVEIIAGVECFQVRAGEEGQKTKSKAAKRFIPLHPEIKKMGFSVYVAEKRKQEEAKLFPELKRDSRGYYSGSFDKWFARFLEKTGAKEDRTSFHSFRHSWRDALRRAEVSIEHVVALGGWSDGNPTHGDYGNEKMVRARADAIAEVRYDELDLSHLYTD